MNWRKWLDEFVLASKGILLATKERRFWFGFIPAFCFFGTLMHLLAGGFAKFDLMAAIGFPGSLKIIGSAFIGVFGINYPFLDWLPVFLIALLQGVLIGLIVLLWHKKRQSTPAKPNKSTKTEQNQSALTKTEQSDSTTNAENVQKAGLIAGLIALGAGCPTCGTTLLTPLLAAITSTGSLALASTISTVVTTLAIIIAVLSLRRLGLEAYVTLVHEHYLKTHQNQKGFIHAKSL